MRIKKSNLRWYVLRWDSNTKKVENYNILYGMAEDIRKEIRAKRIYNMETLLKYLRLEFMHDYWSKAECEFFISDLFGNDYEKIDMWRQIEPNLNRIAEYINTECDLKFK